MINYVVNKITVSFDGFNDASVEMANAAIQYAEEHKENEHYVISEIKVTKQGDEADFEVIYNDNDQPKFSRIRRITGYLTTTVDRWNSAKQSELKHREVHV